MNNTICLSKQSFLGVKYNYKKFFTIIDALALNSFNVIKMNYNNLNWLEEINNLEIHKEEIYTVVISAIWIDQVDIESEISQEVIKKIETGKIRLLAFNNGDIEFSNKLPIVYIPTNRGTFILNQMIKKICFSSFCGIQKIFPSTAPLFTSKNNKTKEEINDIVKQYEVFNEGSVREEPFVFKLNMVLKRIL